MVSHPSESELVAALDHHDELVRLCAAGGLEFWDFCAAYDNFYWAYALDGHESDSVGQAVLAKPCWTSSRAALRRTETWQRPSWPTSARTTMLIRVATVGPVALVPTRLSFGLSLSPLAFRVARPNNSFKPKPLRGSA